MRIYTNSDDPKKLEEWGRKFGICDQHVNDAPIKGHGHNFVEGGGKEENVWNHLEIIPK